MGSTFPLYFPKAIWNAYTPPPHGGSAPLRLSQPSGGSSALPSHLATLPPPSSSSSSTTQPSPHHPSSSSPAHPPPKPTQCKIKLYTFHHGGPQRARKGQMKHETTLEQPCLKVTCGYCWHWRSREMQELHGRVGYGKGAYAPGQTEKSRQVACAGDVVDPRILDGRWRGMLDGGMGEGMAALREGKAGEGEEEGQDEEIQLTPVHTAFVAHAHTAFLDTRGLPANTQPLQQRAVYEYGHENGYKYEMTLSRSRSTAQQVRGLDEVGGKREVDEEKRQEQGIKKTRANGKRKRMTVEEKKRKKQEYDRARRAKMKEVRMSKRGSRV